MNVDRRLFLFALSAPLYAAIPLNVLSAKEAEVVEALCAQIIPADKPGDKSIDKSIDESAGAKEAGVLYYIEEQLAGPLARFSDDYHRGVPLLNNFSREQTGKLFPDLDFEEQTELLHRIESERGSEVDKFFQLVIDHTMQGFYGSPKHGGNKDEVSWRMLGIEDVMEGHKH
jgi:gluconate 2-dehydrogenase gamma chain